MILIPARIWPNDLSTTTFSTKSRLPSRFPPPPPTTRIKLWEDQLIDTREGGQRYCPSCKKIVETRLLLEGYSQTQFYGFPAKKRQIICGTDAEGSNGCGTKWFTLEILEKHVLGKAEKRG
jgi:hypothetical protein